MAYRCGIVVAHAPRPFAKTRVSGEITLFGEIKIICCRCKLDVGCFLIIGVGCHHHQSANTHVWVSLFRSCCQQSGAIAEGKPGFCCFPGNVELQKRVDNTSALERLFLNFVNKPLGINAVYHTDERNDKAYFIGLQMTYKMPFNVFRQCFMLRKKLFYIAFPENALPARIGSNDTFFRVVLAHCHQPYARRQLFFQLPDIFLY